MKQTIKSSEKLVGGCVPSVTFPPSPKYFEAVEAAREALRASGKLLLDQEGPKARDESYDLRF